jgi:hypothetical protein
MGNLQISFLHKYKCCMPQNGDVEESDDDNTRQIVNQIPVMETEKTESFMTTIPCNFRK